VPKGYSRGQILLHWTIALIVLAEWQTHGAARPALASLQESGSIAQLVAEPLAALHVVFGALILVLVILALRLRWKRGAVGPPEPGPPVLHSLEGLTRVGLYGALLATPLAGFWGGLTGGGAVRLHARLATVLLVLIVLHLGAILWRTLVLRDRTILRMLRSER
jgi:cytochrome b561